MTTTTSWQCDTCGRCAVVHRISDGGAHEWACDNCGTDLTWVSVSSAPDACPWPGTHRRFHPVVAILNTSIATSDGRYALRTISAREARSLIAGREILSAVGHEATAQALSAILGQDIPVNRIQFSQSAGQDALVFKLRGRPPEGAVLTLSQIEAIGYDLKIMTRTG